MKTCFLIATSGLVGLATAPLATARTVSEGYTCSAAAFSMIGGWGGIGEVEASMFADADYQPVSTTLKYTVRDRVTGFGKLEASWPVTADGAFLPTVPGYVRIPIRASVPNDFSVTVTLDDAPGVTHRFRRTLQYVTDLDATGFAARVQAAPAVISEADHPWLPDLHVHRTLSVNIQHDGAPTIGDTFLLPNWQDARKQVSNAFRAVEKLRRQNHCDRTMVLRPDDQSGSSAG